MRCGARSTSRCAPISCPIWCCRWRVVEQDYRVVFAPDAVLEEENTHHEAAEYQMRVRVALRAFWALRDMRALLNPLRYPLFSWQLASHKLLRYLSFLPLAIAVGPQLVPRTLRLDLRRPGRAAMLRGVACWLALRGPARLRAPWTGALLLLLPAAQLGVRRRVRALPAR